VRGSRSISAAVLVAVVLFAAVWLTWRGWTPHAPDPLAISPRRAAAFLVVGDLMLARGVAAAMQRSADPLLPFSRMRDVLHSVAFAFGNLESPIDGNHSQPSANRMVFGAPSDALSGLMDAGFTILNLANNHALDRGTAGLFHTSRLLDQNAIQHVGAGSDLDRAWQPAFVAANGLCIAFVGASYASLNDMGAARDVPYIARIEDHERLRRAVASARARADFVVVTMHAGNEYTRKPTQGQIDFAHAAIDAGADLVAGAHSHWVQAFESYKGKPVFYGLGNFVFDQDWSLETRQGLALRIALTKTPEAPSATLERVELLPVVIEHASTPRPANARERQAILHAAGMDDF